MDVSGEVADLMVKESIQLTEASIKLLAGGSKNLTAFLWALAKDSRKLAGETGMTRLLQEGRPLKVFSIKKSDMEDFKKYAKGQILYSFLDYSKAATGMVDLVTNVDYTDTVNLFLKQWGYGVPEEEAEILKKGGPRAQQGSFWQQRENGSTASQTRTTGMTTDEGEGKPSVKGRLAALRAASEGTRPQGKPPQHGRKTPPITR